MSLKSAKNAIFSLAALICLTAGGSAQSGTIIPFSESVADYSSPLAISGFPIDRGIVRTFNFTTGDALDATISGTWGNPLSLSVRQQQMSISTDCWLPSA